MKTVLRCPDCGHGVYRHAPADKDNPVPSRRSRRGHPEAGCSVPGCTCKLTRVPGG